jgi:hypothetical protein
MPDAVRVEPAMQLGARILEDLTHLFQALFIGPGG